LLKLGDGREHKETITISGEYMALESLQWQGSNRSVSRPFPIFQQLKDTRSKKHVPAIFALMINGNVKRCSLPGMCPISANKAMEPRLLPLFYELV
jgi:hypothetical protein